MISIDIFRGARHAAIFLPVLIFALACGPGSAFALDLNLNRFIDTGKDLLTATSGVDEKDEIAIGREVAGRMLGAAHLVNDQQIQSYVNRIGLWVALQTERPTLPWRFGVLDTASINAFAAPGGYVFITRGLYEVLQNEGQLAAVLGHEIGHVIRRHHITVMQKSAAISAGSRLAQRDNRSQWINNMIGTGAEIFARGLDKGAEFEADQVAVVLTARAGYNSYALLDVLHTLEARGSNDASLTLLFKTHPVPRERVVQLGAALEPRLALLPAGKEPSLPAMSAPQAARSAPAPAAARQEPTPEAKSTGPSGGVGIGADPAGLLRGIFGR